MCATETLTRRYLDVLTDHDDEIEIIRVSDTGAVLTRSNGVLFLIHNHAPTTPQLLHVTCGFDTDAPAAHVTAACARVNPRVKGATLLPYPDDNRVVASVEMILAGTGCLPSRDLLAAVLPRVYPMIGNAVAKFLTETTLHGILAATEAA